MNILTINGDDDDHGKREEADLPLVRIHLDKHRGEQEQQHHGAQHRDESLAHAEPARAQFSSFKARNYHVYIFFLFSQETRRLIRNI